MLECGSRSKSLPTGKRHHRTIRASDRAKGPPRPDAKRAMARPPPRVPLPCAGGERCDPNAIATALDEDQARWADRNGRLQSCAEASVAGVLRFALRRRDKRGARAYLECAREESGRVCGRCGWADARDRRPGRADGERSGGYAAQLRDHRQRNRGADREPRAERDRPLWLEAVLTGRVVRWRCRVGWRPAFRSQPCSSTPGEV
jgi:hypothetical protein